MYDDSEPIHDLVARFKAATETERRRIITSIGPGRTIEMIAAISRDERPLLMPYGGWWSTEFGVLCAGVFDMRLAEEEAKLEEAEAGGAG